MGKIKKILETELVGGTENIDIYPVTSIKAVYDENNERLDQIINRRGVVNISTNYNDDHIVEVLTLSQAIAKVPTSDRVLGFVGTFLTTKGWDTYQFEGDSLTDWSDTSKWNSTQNDIGQAMQGIGRYGYWSRTTVPSITIEGSNRVLTWESLTILDTVAHNVHTKYYNNELRMVLPLGGVLVIYGEIVEGETNLSIFYDLTGGSLVDGESHTDYYKAIGNAKDVVVVGIVETINNVPMFLDCLKIASIYWGDNPSLTKDVISLMTSYRQYSYWEPTQSPIFQMGDTDRTLSFPKLSIVRLPDAKTMANSYTQTITINGTSGVRAVYYDLTDSTIYYVGPNNTLLEGEEYSKIITDMGTIIPLGIVNNGRYVDILALSSKYVPDMYDLSSKGEVERLKPNTTDPVIYTKYKWNVVGSVGPTTITDIRLVDILHTRHKYVYLRGKVDFEEGITVPNVDIYLDNNNVTGTGYINLWNTPMQSDAQGNFSGLFIIPDTVWSNVNFDSGYRLFTRINNAANYTLTFRVYEAYVADYAGADNPVIIDNESLEDTIKSVKDLNALITVNEDDSIYGRYSPESPLNLTCPVAQHVNYSATTTNSESNSDGFISEIRVQVSGSGNYTFRVGLLDQNSRFVVSNEFVLSLSNGLNIVNILDKRIPIAEGEQLAVSCTSNAGTSSASALAYRQNPEAINNELFYGLNNGTWRKLNTTYGGEINLSYKVVGIDSIFALKKDLNALTEQVKKQDDIINSLRYVYDNNGVPYKLSVLNGEVVVKQVQYKKVLALGNSLTSHDYADSIGYYGDSSWAMASTNGVTTTWTNHLQTILRQKQPDATVTPFNIATWETNYMGADLDALFASQKDIEYDLIVIRAGENGTAGDDYAQGVDRLVTFLRTNFPLADIIITDMFWHNSVKEAGFMEIAEKYNYPYITFGNIADKCLLGQMLMGVDDEFHPITHNGVANHCTDVCFFDFANILANSLGYSQISGKHTVTINTNIDYSINQTSQIEDGYVSILTYGSSAPTVSINQGGTVIQSTTYSLSGVSWINTPSKIPTFVTTFKMPKGDVVVSM